jgi:hypothetical protein
VQHRAAPEDYIQLKIDSAFKPIAAIAICDGTSGASDELTVGEVTRQVWKLATARSWETHSNVV